MASLELSLAHLAGEARASAEASGERLFMRNPDHDETRKTRIPGLGLNVDHVEGQNPQNGAERILSIHRRASSSTDWEPKPLGITDSGARAPNSSQPAIFVNHRFGGEGIHKHKIKPPRFTGECNTFEEWKYKMTAYHGYKTLHTTDC